VKAATAVAVRQAVRVLLLDQDDRLLLVRFRDGARSWWCTPGGGIEPGETAEQSAIRELLEEAGIELVELGPCIWTRRHAGVFRGRPFDQSERIYLARVTAFEPPTPSPESLDEGFDAIRWWTVAELMASSEETAPRNLADRVRTLLDDGPPSVPIDVGV
jgi:8-oxo-dGTP pyrophosphatase MutT (NUDIX family)